MLKFGIISEIDPAKGFARVNFGEDGIVSDWMPVVVNGSTGNSYSHTFDVNEQVAVLMDDIGLRGVILGAIYNKDAQPQSASKDIVSVVFPNGDKIIYDRNSGSIDIKASGGVTINGNLTVVGSIDASADVTAGPMNTSLTGHVHVVAGVQTGTGSVNTNPPT